MLATVQKPSLRPSPGKCGFQNGNMKQVLTPGIFCKELHITFSNKKGGSMSETVMLFPGYLLEFFWNWAVQSSAY